MNNPSTPPSIGEGVVPVIQADRDAAADCLWRDNQHRTSCKVRDGEVDKNWLVQAFARHRLSFTPPVPDNALREALEPTRAWASTMANMRQGKSSTPRCEPPSEYDVQWAFDRIKEACAAYNALAALKGSAS